MFGGLLRQILLTMLIIGVAPSVGQAESGHGHRPRGVTFQELFQLKTHEGQPLSPADVKGRPFAVFFGFTNCPDVCPTTMLEVAGHLDALGKDADRLKVFFVTIDPERDTPERLKEFLGSFDKRIVGLTGSPIEVAAAAHAFGAYFEKVKSKSGEGYSMDHTLNVYLVDKYGLLSGHIRAIDKPEKAREFMRRILAQ